jgi:hypothetical protein
MTIWNLNVERVRIVGAGARGLGAAELRALVEVAVRNALEMAPLPNGSAMRASVRVNVPSLASGAAIASAVASGVSQAVGGSAHG